MKTQPHDPSCRINRALGSQKVPTVRVPNIGALAAAAKAKAAAAKPAEDKTETQAEDSKSSMESMNNGHFYHPPGQAG